MLLGEIVLGGLWECESLLEQFHGLNMEHGDVAGWKSLVGEGLSLGQGLGVKLGIQGLGELLDIF